MPRDPRAVDVVPIHHPAGCRSYVIVDPASRDACIVDPLLDRVGETARIVSDRAATVRWIVDTHSHGDHLSGAAAWHARSGADVVMHPAAESDVATLRIEDGATLAFGEQGLKVHHARGVTADAIVLEAPGALFTGDTLLIGTVGLKDAPGADADAWFETLHRLFDDRADGVVLHPGHDDMGRDMTTLKHERTGNPWLRQDVLEDFRRQLAADARTLRKDAADILAANRRGLTRVPADLAPASGLLAPAAATERALRDGPRAPAPERSSGPGLSEPVRGVLAVAGGLVVAATALGWWLGAPLLHAVSGLVGLGLMAWVAAPPSRRRRTRDAGLYYEGPARHTGSD